MKSFLIAAVLATAVSVPATGMAAGMAADTSPMATLACRPAVAGEKATAMAGTTSLVCHPLDTAKLHDMMGKMETMMPKMSDAEKTAAKQAMATLNQSFFFPHYPGYDGNPANH